MKEPTGSPQNRRLLTPEELAGVLNVKVSWVLNHSSPSAKNRIPLKRLGRLLRFDLSEVLEWIKGSN